MGRRSQASCYRRLRRFSDGPFPALTVRYGRRYLFDYPGFGPAWMIVGTALVELARYEEAEQAFAKAIEFCPAHKRQLPFAQMGHLFLQAGEYDKALAWYRQAIEADPGDATYHIFLGAALAKQGRLIDAEDAHRIAITCPEGCLDEAYLNLGLVLLARERFFEAADCFREAIRRDPDYRAARQALRDVELCIKLAKGD
ncbi:MAG: tetratricopeptide repeat protein [Isosphaeraceae bacterium]